MTISAARRSILASLASAAAGSLRTPRVVRAQQRAMPVVGFLNPSTAEGNGDRLRAFRLGLREMGFVEGENVAIVYRWAENKLDRLPAMAAELVRRKVAVIVSTGSRVVHFAAKAATTTIPVVFTTAEDPVKTGLVVSLARPAGNLTGINFLQLELTAKRLELLRELVPAATRMAILLDPASVPQTEATLRDVMPAAQALGLQTQVVNASTSAEIDAAFAALAKDRPDLLFVGGTSFFLSRRVQLVNLASRHAIPASYQDRAFADIGGLITYGSSSDDTYRQLGLYTGRILKGAKPADLPVVQATKFELVINHQTSRMLGLTVPPLLLTIADEVIE
jgi:ABC-type uncharacterized transport system substrate-binding protein